MPHPKINIWICLGLALLGCIYPSYSQVPGRPLQVKPGGTSIKPFQESFGKESEFLLRGVKPLEERFPKNSEYFSLGKKWDGSQSAALKGLGLTKDSGQPKPFTGKENAHFSPDKKSDGGRSARAPKALETQGSLSRTIKTVPYAARAKMLLERYKLDPEFQRRADQLRANLIEQGIDKAELTFLPKHSMLDEHSSVQFVANQSDKDIDEARLQSDMKKIAKIVLDNAVHNVLPFEFQTESDCKSALKDAVKKACDELNSVQKLPWTLKFEPESDDLLFQSQDDK